MRVTFQRQYDSYLRDIGRAESAFYDAQARVSSGKRINSLGDDPLGATTSLSLRGLRASLEQYNTNLTRGKGNLALTETGLDETSKMLRRAYELAVSGSNGATSAEGRQAMAKEVEQMQRRLVDLANSQGASGEYLFAGQRNDAKPFTVVGNALTYAGDDQNIIVEVSPNETLAVNLQGEDLFTDAYARLQSLKENLQASDTSRLSGIDLPALQKSDKEFQLARADVGARLRTLEDFKTQNQRRMDELTGQISNVEDVDLSEAIVELKQAETAYQAALQSMSVGQRLSLMDFLR